MTLKHWWVQMLLVVVVIFAASEKLFAQNRVPDAIERVWYNEEQTAKIQVYQGDDGHFFGKIIWLKVPLKDGKAKVDIHNPHESHRNDPILGLTILKDFRKNGANSYTDGTIYDPKNGKTYSCNITNKGNKLDVHGYVGLSIFGRSTYWTLAE